MENINWQWIAGFFEGEGNVSWYEGKRGTKNGTGGRIIIGQNDKRPLVAIKDFLQQQGFTHVLYYIRPARPKNGMPNPIHIIGITQRDEVVNFLQHIEPMLFRKQEKAQYVIERLQRIKQEREDTLSNALAMRQQGKSWREISMEMHITWTTLSNYARSKGIELKRTHPFDRVEWRKARLAEGLCDTCGKSRGKDGTMRKCRMCQNKNKEAIKRWQQKQKLSKA